MKVQEEVENFGRERVCRILVIAGSSVEVSGWRSWVSWERG